MKIAPCDLGLFSYPLSVKNVKGMCVMEEHIKKVIKGTELIEYNEFYRTCIVKKDIEDESYYIIVKMVHPLKPLLNTDGVDIPSKQYKYFVPVVIKGSDDYEYIKDLFDKLVSLPLDSDYDLPL